MGRSKLWRRQDGAVNMPAHSVPARGRSGALAFSSCSSLVAAFRARLKELLQLATCFAGSSHLWPNGYTCSCKGGRAPWGDIAQMLDSATVVRSAPLVPPIAQLLLEIAISLQEVEHLHRALERPPAQ